MYKFVDLKESAGIFPCWSLETIVDGTNLDTKYGDEFKTLNVTGRGLLAPQNKLSDKVGTDGAWLDGSFYPTRTISVEALLQSDDLRALYQSLNYDLFSYNTDLLRIRFTDDMDWYWEGKLSGISEPKEDNRRAIITLDFICPEPFKFRTLKKTIEKGVVYSTLPGLPIRPSQMVCTVRENCQAIRIINLTTGDQIGLHGSFTSGEVIYLDWKAKALDKTIYSAKQGSLLSNLDIFSDFENFTLKKGDKIITKPEDANLSIT